MPEPLRLGMTLTDEVSGTLGKIEQNLKNMARTTEREFRALNRSFEGVGGSIRQIITPALEAFGVSSLTLTGVVGGLYSELSKLAVKSEEMKYSSDWTRLSMERLNRLQNLTNIFGRSLGNLAEDTKTIGNLGFHLTQGFTTDFIRGLHANFRDAGVEKEFHELVGKQGDALLDAIQHILEGKTVRQQQKITQMLHLSQDAARRIMDEALAKKLHIKLDFAVDPEKAEKFHEQQLRLSGHIAELSTDIKNKLFAPFTDWTKELNTWIGAHQKGIESGVVRFFHGLGKAMHETYDAWVLVKPALEKMMEYMNVQKFAEGQAEGKDLTFEGSVQKNWERLQQLWGNVKEEVLENFRAPQQFGEGGGGFAGIRMDPGWQGREPSPGTIEDRRNENPQFAFSPEKPIEEGTRKGITAGLLDYLGPRKRENEIRVPQFAFGTGGSALGTGQGVGGDGGGASGGDSSRPQSGVGDAGVRRGPGMFSGGGGAIAGHGRTGSPWYGGRAGRGAGGGAGAGGGTDAGDSGGASGGDTSHPQGGTAAGGASGGDSSHPQGPTSWGGAAGVRGLAGGPSGPAADRVRTTISPDTSHPHGVGGGTRGTGVGTPSEPMQAGAVGGGGIGFGTKPFGRNQGKPGSGAMPPETLRNILEYAGRTTGVNTEIFAGIEGGHHRHLIDRMSGGIGSADVKLRDPVTGKLLDSKIPAERARMATYIEAAARAGGTGIGHGDDYMSSLGIHVGGGPPAAWGAGGRGPNVPSWVAEAHARGRKSAMSPQQVQARLTEMRKSGSSANASSPQGGGTGASGADASSPQSGRGSPYLEMRRAKLFAELDRDPALRKFVSRNLAQEAGGADIVGKTAAMESWVNQTIRDKKTSLRQTFTGKFFGPIRHGTLTPNTDPDFEKVQAAVRGGSDVAGLRDDQGMINEHGNQPGKIQIGKHGDYFSYKNLKFAQEERKRQREYDATHPRNLDKHLGSQMKSNKIEGDADVRIKVGAEQRQKKRQMFVNHVKQARANPQSPAHEGTGQTTASYEE